jgi:FtsZ-interacting cell division protein YlmF
MPLLYGQLVYTSFPEVGYRVLASAQVPTEIQLAFIEQVVYQHWDAYNPPRSGYWAAYLHQVTLKHTLFGWLYNDGPDDLGRSHVAYFVCYYYAELLHAVQLENIFTCLHRGPVALIDRHSLPAALETIVIPDLWSYQPARRGVAIPSGVRDRSHLALKQKKLLDLFIPVDEREIVTQANEQIEKQQETDFSIYTSDLVGSSKRGAAEPVYQDNLLNMPKTASRILEILVLEPRSKKETFLAIQALREGKIVILKLSAIDPKWAQRAADFVTGATYAIDGRTQLVGERTFLFTPRSVKVSTQAQAVIVKSSVFPGALVSGVLL